MSDRDSLAMAIIAAVTPPDDIQRALIDWIGECPYIESDEQILTDLLGPSSMPGYAISATGSEITKRYIRSGNDFQNTFALYARFRGKENAQRQKNARFLQNFMSWVLSRNQSKYFFPILNGNVQSIETSNGMLFDAEENGDAIYQVQIKLKFYKEA